MATPIREVPSENGRTAPANPPAVIRAKTIGSELGQDTWLRVMPAWIVSGIAHVLLLVVFYFFTKDQLLANPTVDPPEAAASQIDDQTKDDDLTQTDVGNMDGQDTNYDNNRIENVSVPGMVDATAPVGIKEAPEDNVLATVPPPPGSGSKGTGGGREDPDFGNASLVGTEGGYNGLSLPGSFGARGGSAATRMQRAMEGGGTGASEAAVGKGLEWLSLHQDTTSGRWSLDKYNTHAREKTANGFKTFTCNCAPGGQKNDIAGTAFGLLPFLAAGQTHKKTSNKDPKHDYTKTVDYALRFLKSKQGADGNFGGGMYSHGLAAIAMCEAYGMTSDPELKSHAQKGIDYIVRAQHSAGGWRYAPKEAGDTSVVGWQVMALRSGQMAGLSVPAQTLKSAEKFLDSVQTSDGSGYGYTGPDNSPTTTAVGLLCREYLGWTPKNLGLIKGVKYLSKTYKPGDLNSMYYYYYATQVMHHFGGESWETWNPKMRDLLVKSQDNGNNPKKTHQKGSWSPDGDNHGGAGGRIMQTSLSLLTLEVYYRHLPLYRRSTGGGKKEMPAEAKPETKPETETK